MSLPTVTTEPTKDEVQLAQGFFRERRINYGVYDDYALAKLLHTHAESAREEGRREGQVRGLEEGYNLIQSSRKITDEVKRATHLLVRARIIHLKTGCGAEAALDAALERGGIGNE